MDLSDLMTRELAQMEAARVRHAVLSLTRDYIEAVKAQGIEPVVEGWTDLLVVRIPMAETKALPPPPVAVQAVADQIIQGATEEIAEAVAEIEVKEAPAVQVQPATVVPHAVAQASSAAAKFQIPAWTAAEDDQIVESVAKVVYDGGTKSAGYAEALRHLPQRSLGAVSQRAVKHLSERIFKRVEELTAKTQAKAPDPVAAPPVQVVNTPARPEPVLGAWRERAFDVALDAIEDEDWTGEDDHQIAILIARGDGVGAAADAVGCDSLTVRARWAKLKSAAESVFGAWSLDAQKNLIQALRRRAEKAAA